MSSPFPLLRLPRLVLYEVFKSLRIGETIKLSLCSKKISTQIKDARLYSQKVIVYLDMSYQRIRVYSENNVDLFEISIHPDSGKSLNLYTQQCSIACCTVRIVPVPNGIKIFWKNQQEGYLSVIQHLLKIFQCKVSTKNSCYDSDIFHSTISKLFDLQLEFKRLTIRLNGSKHNNLLFNQISNKFGLVENLNISSVHDPSFSPVFTLWPQNIDIPCSAWFTLEYLLTCTCTRITLFQSHLANNDLDVILKNWKTGGFPNLEYLYLRSRNITNNGTTVLGMELWELDGMVIQTDDGSKKTTIKTNDQNIEISPPALPDGVFPGAHGPPGGPDGPAGSGGELNQKSGTDGTSGEASAPACPGFPAVVPSVPGFQSSSGDPGGPTAPTRQKKQCFLPQPAPPLESPLYFRRHSSGVVFLVNE